MNSHIKAALPGSAFARAAMLAVVAAPLLAACHDEERSAPPARPAPPTCESFEPGTLPRLEFPKRTAAARTEILEYDHESYTPPSTYPRINIGNHLAYTLNGMLIYTDDVSATACTDRQKHSVAGYAVTAGEEGGTRTNEFERATIVRETANAVSVVHGKSFGPFDQYEVARNGDLIHILGYDYNAHNGFSHKVDMLIQHRPDGHGGQDSYVWTKGGDYHSIIVSPGPDGLRIVPNETRPPS